MVRVKHRSDQTLIKIHRKQVQLNEEMEAGRKGGINFG